MADLNGIPSIIRMINRVKLSKFVDTIVLATGISKENNILEDREKETQILKFLEVMTKMFYLDM